MSITMKSMSRMLGGLVVALAMVVTQTAQAGSAAEIDEGVKSSLERFAKEIDGGKAFLEGAKGLLVFPKIYKGGIVVGGEYGEGALLIGNKTVDYYSSAAVSVGWQLGAQSKTVVVAFMTMESLEKFRNSSGWKAGVDGSVALVDMGAGKSLDTKTIKDPVVGFVFGQKGLMYNLTLEGSKFEKITPKK